MLLDGIGSTLSRALVSLALCTPRPERKSRVARVPRHCTTLLWRARLFARSQVLPIAVAQPSALNAP